MELLLGLLTLALSGIAAFFGSYFGGYAKQKGENLATHEDINKLVDEVSAVTTTAKQIEAKISGDMWDRQKHWELKRDVLFELTKRSGELKDALTKYFSICQTNNSNKPIAPERKQETIDAGRVFLDSKSMFDNSAMQVGLVCGKSVYLAALMLAKITNEIFTRLQREEVMPFEETIEAFSAKYLALHDEVRKELGFAAHS
jgi:hypothetical protein